MGCVVVVGGVEWGEGECGYGSRTIVSEELAKSCEEGSNDVFRQ